LRRRPLGQLVRRHRDGGSDGSRFGAVGSHSLVESETDQDDTTAGFQPDLSYLHVADSTVCPRSAMPAASRKRSIWQPRKARLSDAGEYVDPFLIDGKSVTVQGARARRRFFSSRLRRCPRRPQLSERHSDFELRNTVLDGLTDDFDTIKTNSRIGVRYVASSGTISNCAVKNLSMPDSGGGYSEIAFYLRADSGDDANRKSINVLNNEFIDAGRVGVLTHYWVTSNITGNTFTKTFDDFGYAINVGLPIGVDNRQQTITGYDTPPLRMAAPRAAFTLKIALRRLSSVVTTFR
jgi:hypothetical protein